MKTTFSKKLRHGSLSLGITAAVLAAVLLLNVLLSFLCTDRRWFIDVSGDERYTLSETAKDYLSDVLDSVNEDRAEDDPVKVKIIFCAEPDILYGNERMRSIYYTALEMQKEFSKSIEVECVDVLENPSAVDDYRSNSYSNIYQSNIIVASGTEFRILTYRSFYTFDEDNTTIWAYSGEKQFVTSIVAVTRADSPICALTVNHGEPFATEAGRAQYSEFLHVIESAGYEICYLNLTGEELPEAPFAKTEIPENCRLILTFDPQEDFASVFHGDSISETSKLEKHLSQAYSFMAFFDADTPRLPMLEEFLEEWGISIGRYSEYDDAGHLTEGNLLLKDPGNAINSDGTYMVAEYAPEGIGVGILADLKTSGIAPKVVFGNAVPLHYSSIYQKTYVTENTEKGTGAYIYGYYYKNDWERAIYDVLCAGELSGAHAQRDGRPLTDPATGEQITAYYDAQDPFRLMTLTKQSYQVTVGYVPLVTDAYVCAFGSTDFASNDLLLSEAYGNTDVLLATLRTIGTEVDPVDLPFKKLYSADMDTKLYDGTKSTPTAIVLVLLPAVIMTGTGLVVLVRRKLKH